MDTQKLRELATKRDEALTHLNDVDTKIAALKRDDAVAALKALDEELAAVVSGAKPFKQRAEQKCSLCHETGHSARTCPNREKQPTITAM